MTAKLFALQAILVAPFAVTPSPVRSELPEAPPPRMKKTTAELLVGTWKRVAQQNLPALPPDWDLTIEYTKDGRVVMMAKVPMGEVPPLQTGTFRLDGKTLERAMDPPSEPRLRTV